MTVAFPSTIPRPQRNGYGYQLSTPVEAAANDRGMGITRRVGAGTSVRMTLTWIFTRAHLVTFAAWWRDTAAHGTLPFTIVLLNGYTDASQEVRAIGTYACSMTGGRWTVKLPVELVAMPVASQVEMQEAIDNFQGLRLADELHRAVHVTIPWGIS